MDINKTWLLIDFSASLGQLLKPSASSEWPRSEAIGRWSWPFTGAIPHDLPRSHTKGPTRALGTSFGYGELRPAVFW